MERYGEVQSLSKYAERKTGAVKGDPVTNCCYRYAVDLQGCVAFSPHFVGSFVETEHPKQFLCTDVQALLMLLR